MSLPLKLKFPFTWQERQVLIKDRIWYIPSYFDRYEEFIFPGWSHPDLFGNDQPVYIEYCSGNGAWVAEKAKANPQYNWVAVERKFERVAKIWSKLKKQNLSNLFIICGNGETVTQHYIPPGSVKGIFINFPDPWPKQRHSKHRIIQPEFVEQMSRCLISDGSVTFVTDDAHFSEWTLGIMNKKALLKSIYPSPGYITENPWYGSSYFESLWREKGKVIRYHCFKKDSE